MLPSLSGDRDESFETPRGSKSTLRQTSTTAKVALLGPLASQFRKDDSFDIGPEYVEVVSLGQVIQPPGPRVMPRCRLAGPPRST